MVDLIRRHDNARRGLGIVVLLDVVDAFLVVLFVALVRHVSALVVGGVIAILVVVGTTGVEDGALFAALLVAVLTHVRIVPGRASRGEPGTPAVISGVEKAFSR
ncbi:hypothetical protein GCM10022627_40040 [Haloarcula argentinensis]